MSADGKPLVLIIDDEVRSLESMERNLKEHFEIRIASNIKAAEKILEEEWVQIILCDQRMPDMSGVSFLTIVREKWPDIVRIIISGYTDAEDIITGINEAGIYQYITKPWQPENLILTLKNAASLFELQRQNELLAIELKMLSSDAEKIIKKQKNILKENYSNSDGIIRAEDSPMNEICDIIYQIASYDLSVLLSGESGTGKELAARALHYSSHRWDKPFVVENCGALPDELLESELFGHKRGAFTGAVEDHMGLFERADGGTIFLDEIGDVSQAFQVKLLRVLQEGEFRPVGSSKTKKTDVRVIAATNKNLEDEIKINGFREDLYFRLAGVTINMPSLRERKMDIEVLANHIYENTITKLGKQNMGISQEAIECMKEYHWPGNVRELQNEIQRMIILADENKQLGADLLSSRVVLGGGPEDSRELFVLSEFEGSLKDRVEILEAKIVKETLIRHRWNKSRAAKELGLSRVGLRSKLERYGLEKIETIPANNEIEEKVPSL